MAGGIEPPLGALRPVSLTVLPLTPELRVDRLHPTWDHRYSDDPEYKKAQEPGDPPEVIHEAVGFPITWDQADQPGFEWMNDHGSWFELAYVLTDDFGMLVFVADHPETNFVLRFNCLGFANRPSATEGKA
jgi:hypothetical protein